MMTDLHRRLSGAGRREWGESVEELPLDDVDSLPADTGNILRLLHAFGLRRARTVVWVLNTADAHRATWDPQRPVRWLLERRVSWKSGAALAASAWTPDAQPPPGSARQLIVPRPYGMDDAGLTRMLPARCAIRAALVAGRPLTDADADAITDAVAGLVAPEMAAR